MKTETIAKTVFTLVLYAVITAAMLLPSTASAEDNLEIWGYNAWGQADAPTLPSGVSYTDASGSYYHTVAVRSDGQLEAFGYNGWGNNNVPALPAGLTYVACAAGQHHSVALRSDGSVIGFGYNGNGQLNIPALPGGVTYTQVSAGYQNTVLLRSDGQVVAFGYNGWGNNNVPALPSGVTYTKVSAGYHFTLALRSDGNISAFGYNGWGSLNVPALPPGETYTDISAGTYHNLALRSDGQVVAFGLNRSGSNNVPALPAGTSYIGISAGREHSMAQRSDGTVVAFGSNAQGQSSVPVLPEGTVYLGLEHSPTSLHAMALTKSLVTVTLNGDADMQLLLGDPFSDPGATATDEIGNPLAVTVTGGPVNPNIPGAYVLTYSATDANGIPGSAKRTVTVVKKLQSDLWVAAMPSYAQSRSYANAALNEPILVWGRAWNGTAPYTYDLDYGDGSAHLTGTANAAQATCIGADHTYTSSGTKTMSLKVTDADGRTLTRSAQIRVIVTPTHDERVNMAIEKGLVYLYKHQQVIDANRIYFPGWIGTNHPYSQAMNGASLMAFEENGHLPDLDYEEFIYAETVQRGLNLIFDNGQGAVGTSIPQHSDGIAVRDSDSNGNGGGAWLANNSYANAWACMAVILSQRNGVEAQNEIVKSGPFAGMSYYEVIQDNFDQFSYNQGDGGIRGSWVYSINGQNAQGRWDGSAQQWPSLAFKAGIDRWGLSPQQWTIDNTVHGFQTLQNGGFSNDPNAGSGGVGYTNNSGWLNCAKTGGSMVGFSTANKTVGDPNVDRGIRFISNNWTRSHDPGWAGDFYAMYGVKKGLAINEVTTLPSGAHAGVDWYQDLSGWLLGPKSVATITPTISGSRSLGSAYGQYPDGHWQNSGHINNANLNFTTANAILILTKSLTKPLPIAVAEPVPDQSARFPAAFTLDGSNSFHTDPDANIVEYLWILDAGSSPDWSNPDATGAVVSVNPGWDTASVHTATLRIKDDQDPANFATAIVNINVSFNDVAPVAVAIPAAQVPAVYAARVGEEIELDGSESFDPEGDPIVSYAWDLDANGTFGDAADAALDTSGQNAQGVTAGVLFTEEYTGQVGLQVCSQPDIVGAPVLCSNNNAFIDIQVSPSDFFVSNISAEIVISGEEANVSATLNSASDSGKDFTGVQVKFYTGDPLAGGTPVGPNLLVDLTVGGSTSVGPINLTGLGGAESVFVYVDSNTAVAEYDETNNTASVNVSNNPPIAIAQNVTVSADANCQGVVTVAQIDNGSSDPDGDEITLSVSPEGPYPLGETEVTLTVSDGKEEATATATVTVVDTTPPTVVSCPDDQIIECPAPVVFGTPVFADNCDDDLTVTSEDESLAVAGKEVTKTKRTWTATDDAGLSVSCSQTITVEDNTAPTVTSCPADVVLECPDTQEFGTPVFADTCDANLTVTSVDEDLALGAKEVTKTKRTWTATDDHGNSVSCSQTITTEDNTAPTVVSCPADEVIECPTPVEFGTPVFADTCDADLTVTFADVDQALTGQEVSKTTRTWTATDDNGNSISCSQTIAAQDTTDPVITSPAGVCIVSDAGSCDATNVDIGTPVVSDTCDPAPVVTNDHPSTTYPVGVTTVTWTVTDHTGNTASSTQTVTVLPSVSVTWRPPLKGQPVANAIRVGQVVPHKVLLEDCTGLTMTSGITVMLRIQGIEGSTGDVLEEVIEDAQGVGSDGTVTSDGIMVLTDSQWHFNVDTGNFGDPNTVGGDNYYESTVTVTDNATGKVLGTSSVKLETKSRGK